MPGMKDGPAGGGPRQPQVEIDKAVEDLIASALPDFTHFTVLMFLTRQAKGAVRAEDIAAVTGDSRETVGAVLERFGELGLVEAAGGPGPAGCAYRRDGPLAGAVAKLLRYWEHSRTHQTVLCRLLVHPPGTKAGE